jgi:hypothetical protein
MSKIYNTIVRQSEKFKNSSQETLQLSRNDKRMLDLKEVAHLAGGLQKVGDTQGRKTGLLIRGESKLGWQTLKGFDDDIESIEEYIDYFNNKVQNKEKFNGFYQLQVTIISTSDKVLDRGKMAHYKIKHPEPKIEKEVSKAIFKKPKKK